MIKKMNKKGFTLAELLIVVAIIAVLTAIAVPLFVGALDEAETNVKNANISAVREAAITKILLNNDTGKDYRHYTESNKSVEAKCWDVVAYVTANGDIHDMTITPCKTNTITESACGDKLKADEEGSVGKGKKGDYKVSVKITELDVTIPSST